MKVRDALAAFAGSMAPPAAVALGERSPSTLAREADDFVLFQVAETAATPLLDTQLSRALDRVREALDTTRRRTSPGIWICGPHGSGKTTLAKLLSLSLDGGPPAEAWVPHEARSREALRALREEARPFAVSVDMAKRSADEPVHAAMTREVLSRLGSSRMRAPLAEKEAVDCLYLALRRHAPNRTLFLVVDDLDRAMTRSREETTRLASFVAHLSQRFKGRAWLLATSLRTPEESSVGAARLSDAFPAAQRVVLTTSHVLENLDRRLLRKTEEGARALRRLAGLSDAERQEGPSDDERLRAYPATAASLAQLSGLISSLRERSKERVPSLQGLLFERVQGPLGDEPLGRVLSLDDAFDVLGPFLDPEVARVLARFDRSGAPPLAARAARAVALLAAIPSEPLPSAERLSDCLVNTMDLASRATSLGDVLDPLVQTGHFLGSAEHGLALPTEDERAYFLERDKLEVTGEDTSESVRQTLDRLLDDFEAHRKGSSAVVFSARYSDGKRQHDTRLRAPKAPGLQLDFRYLPAYRRGRDEWLGRSGRLPLLPRLIWVAEGDRERVASLTVELARARRMCARASSTQASPLTPRQARRLEMELRLAKSVELRLRASVAEAFMQGSFYFRGEQTFPRALAATFVDALTEACDRALAAGEMGAG